MKGLLPAYIDPGAGTIIIQMLVASLVGIGILFRRSVANIFRFFRRRSLKK